MMKEYIKHLNKIYRFPIITVFLIGAILYNLIYFIGRTRSVEYFKFSSQYESVLNFYLLLICVIVIIFIVGMDYVNSMGEISLVASKGRSNSYILKKLSTFLLIYTMVYIITQVIFLSTKIEEANNGFDMLTKSEFLIYSLVTQVFVIGLTLAIISTIRNIQITLVLITTYYFVQEFLWRSKITGEYGILAHRYHSDILEKDINYKIKLIYFIVGVLLIMYSYISLGRRVEIKRLFNRK